MVLVRIEMVPQLNYQLSPNGGAATVELEPITEDVSTWKHWFMLPTQLQQGKPVVSRKQDVSSGTYPVYCGITLAYAIAVELGFDIKIYDDASNKLLFSSTFYLPQWQKIKVQQVGTLNVNPPAGTVTLYLTVGSNGTVKVYLPDRIETKTPGSYTYSVSSGAWITLEAIPNTGYYFDGYYELGVKIYSSSKFMICMLMNRNIEARFAASQSPPSGNYILTYNVGSNGTLYIDGVAYRNTSGQKTYSSGATVKLEVKPDTGYQVDRFAVDGVVLKVTSTTITMDTNHSVDASFTKAETGGGGTTTTTYDPSQTIKDMMEKMVPPMINMMGMMMMMQMMVSMMSSIAQSFA